MSDQITESQRAFFLEQAYDRQQWAVEHKMKSATADDMIIWQDKRIKALEAENEQLKGALAERDEADTDNLNTILALAKKTSQLRKAKRG